MELKLTCPNCGQQMVPGATHANCYPKVVTPNPPWRYTILKGNSRISPQELGKRWEGVLKALADGPPSSAAAQEEK